jgi:hypothetical protein
MLGRVVGLAGRAVGLVAGASVGLVSGTGELMAAVSRGVMSAQDRRVYVRLGRVPVGREDVTRLEGLIAGHEGVLRAEVNAVLGHVLVEIDPSVNAPTS